MLSKLPKRVFVRKHDIQAELQCMDALEFIVEYCGSIAEGKRSQIDLVLMFDSVEHIPRANLPIAD